MKRLFTLVITLMLHIMSPLMAQADVLTTTLTVGGQVTASALGGKAASDIIQDARNQVQDLMAEGENSTNVLLTRGADSLNMAIDNVVRQLDGQLNKTFEQLDQTSKNMLLGLANATLNASNLVNKAYTFKDTLALDTRSILGDIPFVKEKLVLQRVTGLSSIAGRDEFDLTLIGSYVGLSGADHRTKIGLTINGQEIEGVTANPTEIHKTNITIPLSSVLVEEPSKEPVRIPLTFNIEQSFDEQFLGFLWTTTETKTYSSTVTLTIYPRYAGELEVTARHLKYGWVKDEPIQRKMTHSAHCESSCGDWYGRVYSVYIDVEGNQLNPKVGDRRIVGHKCQRTGGTSGFSVNHDISVSKDKSKATCSIRFRTRSQTYTSTAQIERYQITSEEDKKITLPIYFGKSTEVKVPESTKLVLLKSKLVTGEEVDLIDTEVDARSPVQIIKIINNHQDKSVFVSVKDPAI
ncbi:hypothetical protein [Vibrio neptunius]|uniref:hypothetical protein n=1 Tax=Vibrio neptunius TaxID=170651 RepID=UPI0019D197A0|nr:hypothetical protein [Vibrio neptunius]MBN3574018.1 hypothetical protein [Vibrio neptunius]